MAKRTKAGDPAKPERQRERVPRERYAEFVAEFDLTISVQMPDFLARWGVAERTAQQIRARVAADPKLAAERVEKREELRAVLDEKLRDLIVSAHTATLEAIVHHARLAKDLTSFDPKVFHALNGGNKVAQEQGTARKVLDPDEQRLRPGRKSPEPATPAGEGEGGAGGTVPSAGERGGNGHVEPELVH